MINCTGGSADCVTNCTGGSADGVINCTGGSADCVTNCDVSALKHFRFDNRGDRKIIFNIKRL